jgi:acyl-coenzyme A thioesterase PaaI-like protein
MTTPALTFDYSRLTGSGEAGVPFSSHVGVVVESSDATAGTARLDPAAHVLNHVGSLHGGAVFSVAAAAAGALSRARSRRRWTATSASPPGPSSTSSASPTPR